MEHLMRLAVPANVAMIPRGWQWRTRGAAVLHARGGGVHALRHPRLRVARVHCDACQKDDVVAFSCKGARFCRLAGPGEWWTRRRGWWIGCCPSAGAAVGAVVRSVRVLCAYDPDACAAVRRILLRAVSGYYERRARRERKVTAAAGAVAFVRRFDSGMRLDVTSTCCGWMGACARTGQRADGVLRTRRSDGR
jgi:hypothetical protein